jgi:L-amino acid N-acyltransferase YncA
LKHLDISIKAMTDADWKSVAQIYRQGIETGNATFEQEVPSWEVWNCNHLKSCRIVALSGNTIVGWAALSPVSSRCVYAGVAEVSVYVSTYYQGMKIGRQLLEKLIADSEKENLWTLQAGIFPENIASIRLHESLGFRLVGKREKIGMMNGRWRDTILLERRSKKTGVVED